MRAKRSQRGAVAVELALVALVLVPLTCAMLDFGFAFQKYQTLQSGVRAAARSAAMACAEVESDCSGGNRPWDDRRIMTALAGALRANRSEVERVVVYRLAPGSPTDTPPPAACQQGTPVAGECNVYDASDFAQPATAFDCTTGKASSWPACTRVRPGPNTEFVGVWVRLRHRNVTGLFGPVRMLSDVAVFRLEPLPDLTERRRQIPVPPVVATTSTVPPSTTTTEPPPSTTTTEPPPTTSTTIDPSPTTTVTATPTTGPTTIPATTAPTTLPAPTVAPATTAAPTTTTPPPPTTPPPLDGGF